MTSGVHSMEEHENRKRIKNSIILISFMFMLFATFIFSLNAGYAKISPLHTLNVIFGGGSSAERLILFEFRLPRIVISMLVGMGLALSGCIIQGVTKNPLADPGLLGINAGAGIMALIYVVIIGANSIFSIFTLPILALIGGIITAVIIYLLAYKKNEGIAPVRLILNGVAIQAGISAAMTVMVIKLDESQFEFIAAWQAGSIWGANWKFVLAILPWFLVCIPYVLLKSRILDVLNFGDEIAYGLGVAVEKERRSLLFTAVALASSCVAVGGGINFVGMIAPHLARRIVGPRHRALLPACALLGALLVSVSDTLARTIIQPSEIPTGIVVAVIGAPYFLYLLVKSKN